MTGRLWPSHEGMVKPARQPAYCGRPENGDASPNRGGISDVSDISDDVCAESKRALSSGWTQTT